MINSNETPVCARCKHVIVERKLFYFLTYYCRVRTDLQYEDSITGEIRFMVSGKKLRNKYPRCRDLNYWGFCQYYERKEGNGVKS